MSLHHAHHLSFTPHLAHSSPCPRLQRLRLERGSASENIGKLANAPALLQLELVDFSIGVGFRAGIKLTKNIKKLLIIPTYQVNHLFNQQKKRKAKIKT